VNFAVVATWCVHTLAETRVLRSKLLDCMTPNGATAPAGVFGSVAQDVLVVASELATNALRHGRPPTVVQLLRRGNSLALDVADHDASSAPVIAGQRPVGEGGYGMVIARRLAEDVGWYTTPPTKHIWATFAAQA
jgi:serine/threonine-protein kinase RsbW